MILSSYRKKITSALGNTDDYHTRKSTRSKDINKLVSSKTILQDYLQKEKYPGQHFCISNILNLEGKEKP